MQPPHRGFDQFGRAVPAQDLPGRDAGVFFECKAKISALLIRVLCQKRELLPEASENIFRDPQRVDIDRKIIFHLYAVINLSSVKHMRSSFYVLKYHCL